MFHWCWSGLLSWLGKVEATGLLDAVILVVIVDIVARTAIEILLALVHYNQVTVSFNDGLITGLVGVSVAQSSCCIFINLSSSCWLSL